MDFDIVFAVKSVAIILLIFLSALFSGSETALFSLNALQMHDLRSRGGTCKKIVTLLEEPQRILSTILIGNTLVNVLMAALGFSVIESIKPLKKYAAPLSVGIMTLLLLIFGEIAPKRIAVKKAYSFAKTISFPICICYYIFTPFRLILEFFSSIIKKQLKPERKSLSDEELLTAIEISTEEGYLDSEERKMASGIMQLSNMTASDVMTPRVDFVGIDLDEPEESYLALIRSQDYHFLPVFCNTPDDIEGFLDVRAYLIDPVHDFEKATQKPIFVPETMTLDDILLTMQRSRRHIVCVMDEYGGTAGLVTRGDILEVFVGDIPTDSSEKPEETIVQIAPNKWNISGDTSIEEINARLDLELETDGADRISGWAISQAGRFLRTGESVEADGCRVRITKHKKLRVISVELEKIIDKTDQEDSVENDDETIPEKEESYDNI